MSYPIQQLPNDNIITIRISTSEKQNIEFYLGKSYENFKWFTGACDSDSMIFPIKFEKGINNERDFIVYWQRKFKGRGEDISKGLVISRKNFNNNGLSFLIGDNSTSKNFKKLGESGTDSIDLALSNNIANSTTLIKKKIK